MAHERPHALASLKDLRAATDGWRRAGERIVLVPTMGALHEGHLSLVAQARTLGRRVVASVFVNPTQFGPSEDFSRYPRTLEADLDLLARAGADAVWLPSVEAMYPAGFATRIEVDGLGDGLCGAFRPGHFSGVATVVAKLLNQVRPDVALFGEKDFQQLCVIRRAIRDLDMPIEIHGAPTLREPDGLALSSRNRYLDTTERTLAPRLYEALDRTARRLEAGEPAAPLLRNAIRELETAGFGPVQYLDLRDEDTLAAVDLVERPARLLVAAYLGRTRLIDNVRVLPRDARPAGS